jgi:hypothetical protein
MNPVSNPPAPLGKRIDEYSHRLGNATRARLSRIETFSEECLERIMFEAWYVSVHN